MSAIALRHQHPSPCQGAPNGCWDEPSGRSRGSTARGAGRSGAQHAMAVNETVLAFVLGGSAPGAAGGVGTVRSWSTETEFPLLGGKRKVRPDGVWQAPEIGVPVLMVEVDRSTMAIERVAAKFTAYRELFRVKTVTTAWPGSGRSVVGGPGAPREALPGQGPQNVTYRRCGGAAVRGWPGGVVR
ncbi:replication-relaxation family protein [Kitasatospora sp. NPDC056531]|uniref:replication-relaxation family protein n=1 Tax=Kitasatospora sp. NPDC056531 TaxID=3345856 RepID=UPI0036BBF4FF